MRRVTGSHGFTIIETLIFLAVSGVMFASAILVVGGQQAKTEFRQGAGELRSRIDDTVNNVATGYYTTNGNLQCTNFWGPAVSNATGPNPEQGTNLYCIVPGTALQFRTDSNNSSMYTYTVVGRRLVGAIGTRPTQNLSEALATLALTPGSYTQNTLPFGLRTYSAYYQDTPGGVKTSVYGFAVTSSLASYTASGALQSGTSTINVVPIAGGSAGNMNVDEPTFRTAAQTAMRSATPVINPEGGITVCVDSGGTDQHMLLKIATGSSVATGVQYRSGSSASDVECSV